MSNWQEQCPELYSNTKTATKNKTDRQKIKSSSFKIYTTFKVKLQLEKCRKTLIIVQKTIYMVLSSLYVNLIHLIQSTQNILYLRHL